MGYVEAKGSMQLCRRIEGQALNSRLTEASTIGNKKRRVGGMARARGVGGKGRGWVEQLK